MVAKSQKNEAVAARHRATERSAGTATSPVEQMLKPAQMAALLLMTTERLRQLAREGFIPAAERAGYPLQATVQGYLRFRNDDERRVSKSAASSRVSDARAREIEMRIARDERHLVDMDDVEAVFTNTIGIFRSELSGVPAGATRDRIVRAAIEKGINGALTRCGGRFAEASSALRAGRDPLPGEGEDDA